MDQIKRTSFEPSIRAVAVLAMLLAPTAAVAGRGSGDNPLQSYYLLGPGFDYEYYKSRSPSLPPERHLAFPSFKYRYFTSADFDNGKTVTLTWTDAAANVSQTYTVVGCSRLFEDTHGRTPFQQCTLKATAIQTDAQGQGGKEIALCAKPSPVTMTKSGQALDRQQQLQYVNVQVVHGKWDLSKDGRDQAHYFTREGDHPAISFACDSNTEHQGAEWNGAVTKCSRWGFPNGLTPKDEVEPDVAPGWEPGDLAERQFLACVRMARADYCGNGQSETKLGTAITFFTGDGEGKPLSCSEGMCLEAIWDSNGAVEVFHMRWNSQSLANYLSLPAIQPWSNAHYTVNKHCRTGVFTKAWKDPKAVSTKALQRELPPPPEKAPKDAQKELNKQGPRQTGGTAVLEECLGKEKPNQCDRVTRGAADLLDDRGRPPANGPYLYNRSRLNDGRAPDLSYPCDPQQNDFVCEQAAGTQSTE